MARLDNWQNNLGDLIETKREMPFDFLTHNCLLWAFDAILAVSGNDLGVKYRGKFKTVKAASRLLAKVDGVGTSQELLQKYLGELQPISFARQGDIVLINPENTELELPADIERFGLVPGVCYGAISYFVGEYGLIKVDTLTLGQALWVS